MSLWSWSRDRAAANGGEAVYSGHVATPPAMFVSLGGWLGEWGLEKVKKYSPKSYLVIAATIFFPSAKRL